MRIPIWLRHGWTSCCSTLIFVGALVTCGAACICRPYHRVSVMVEAEYLQQERAPEIALTALFTMVALMIMGFLASSALDLTLLKKKRYLEGEQRYGLASPVVSSNFRR